MSRTRHSKAEMIAAVRQLPRGRRAEEVAREAGVSKRTIYAWRAKLRKQLLEQIDEVGTQILKDIETINSQVH